MLALPRGKGCSVSLIKFSFAYLFVQQYVHYVCLGLVGSRLGMYLEINIRQKTAADERSCDRGEGSEYVRPPAPFLYSPVFPSTSCITHRVRSPGRATLANHTSGLGPRL